MTPDLKLIAVDLDGTLLNDRRQIPDGFFDLVSNLHKRGVQTVIASGRQYFNLVKLFAPLQDKLFFICENGGLIFKSDQQIFSQPIAPDLIKEVWTRAEALPPVTALVCGAKAAYLKPCRAAVEEEVRHYYERCLILPNACQTALADDCPVKLALYIADDAMSDCARHFADLQSRLQIALAGKNWLDIMHPETNKGAAIGFLQNYLQISPANCLAFGDYPNDIQMLKQVKYSYGMSNGHPDLLAVAKYRAPSNNAQGVMQILHKYFD